jgi:hypothetical protein
MGPVAPIWFFLALGRFAAKAPLTRVGFSWISGGEQHARYADKSHGAIAAKHRTSEGETTVGVLPLAGRLHI